MNKLYLILIIISIKSNAQKKFEGLIKFTTHISTTELAPKDFDKDLEKKYGDSLIMYYSSYGDFKRVHKNSDEFGSDYQLFISNKGVLYITSKEKNVDSLNVNLNSLELKNKKKINNEIIMGLDCECYQYEATSMYQQNVVLNYCFSKKTPKLNEKLYYKHNDFFLYDFYKISKRPYLKFSISTDEFNITYVANELINQSLNKDIFQLK
jgi:hypothetical protein